MNLQYPDQFRLEQQALDFKTYLLYYLQDLLDTKTYDDAKFIDIVNQFKNTFTNSSGKINESKLQEFARRLLKHALNLSFEDMQEAAERSIADAKEGETVYFYSEKTNLSPSADGTFSNSNAFMLALVQSIGKKRGIKVEIVKFNEGDMVESVDTLRILDDSIYSGSQISDSINKFKYRSNKPISIRVFAAGSTPKGSLAIQNTTQFTGIPVTVDSVKRIPVIKDYYPSLPELETFFKFTELSRAYSSELSDPEKVLKYIESKSERLTLCRTDYKVPDQFSMMNELSDFLDTTLYGNTKYPAINF